MRIILHHQPTVTDHIQRTNLGDPSFVDGMDQYQQDMLNETSIRTIRSKILDSRTQDVSVYDPDGLESLDTWVNRWLNFDDVANSFQARNVSHCECRSIRLGCDSDKHDQLVFRQSSDGARNRNHHEQRDEWYGSSPMTNAPTGLRLNRLFCSRRF